jgi:hypothetical protein
MSTFSSSDLIPLDTLFSEFALYEEIQSAKRILKVLAGAAPTPTIELAQHLYAARLTHLRALASSSELSPADPD